MNVVLLPATLICLLLALGLIGLSRKAASHQRARPISLEWINGLSADRYRPMERLLDEADCQFLASQPGFERTMAKRLCAQRRRIFRIYLRSLHRDFNRVCDAIKVRMLESPQDRPDLAKVLLKQRALFAMGIMAVRFRLVLHGLGWSAVDVRPLVGAFDSMRMELRRLAPVLQPVGAE